jgi:hypothetical protein
MPRTVLELLTSWGTSVGYGRAKEAWRLAPLCLLWCIWQEQNARLFEDVEISMVELRKRLLNMLYIWIASHHCLNDFTYDFQNYFLISREFYKKRKDAPKHTGSIHKDTKIGKRGEGEKHPKNPNRRKPRKPLQNQPTKPRD